MSDRLPPLTALRAFEAAARHMSFALAAEELNVTPAALSFQIKSLEEHLGAPVFRRLNRAVELTDAGRTLVPGTREGFTALNSAWSSARRMLRTSHLKVTAGPAFTAIWLAPRLFDFARAHPNIELSFTASLRILDLDRDDVDVAIRFGQGPDAGLYSERLIGEWATPIMTPELAKQYPTQESLLQAPLIRSSEMDFMTSPTWPSWFQSVGLPVPEFHGPIFSQADHAIDAALSGAGIILGRISLTVTSLRKGVLVAPFGTALKLPAQTRFVCRKGAEHLPHIIAFKDWLRSEINDLSEWESGRTFLDAPANRG